MTSFDFIVDVSQPIDLNAKLNDFVPIAKKFAFQNAISVPNIIVYQKSHGQQIVVLPAQYDYKCAQTFDWDKDSDMFDAIAETANCFVSNNSIAGIQSHFVNIIEAKVPDLFSVFKSKTAFDMGNEVMRGISSLGFRFFVNNIDGSTVSSSELKMEPYLQDHSKVYFEAFYRFAKPEGITAKLVAEKCNAAYIAFRATSDNLLSELLK